MADSTVGEPLAWRHGVLLYSAQSAYGTAVTPATSCGAFAIGLTKKSGNYDIRGPGSPNFLARKGGSTNAPWVLRTDALQTGAKTLLLKAQRASGVLPIITLGVGYSDDQGTPNRSADQVQDCKVQKMSLSGDASSGHGPIKCELSGTGGLVTPVTSLAAAVLSSTPWSTDEGVMTRAAGAYPMRSFGLDLDHTVSLDHVIPGSAPAAFVRGHSYQTEHGESISGKISRYQRSGESTQAATITQSAMVWVFTNRVDSVVLTLTFATCDFDEEVQDQGPDGIFWSFNFTAKTLVIS